ncbi:MAG TPA: SbcC/MukB-like Walker B domain-containing protein, partial [Azospirillaceae bacterium]|nr:SbcC/MukB-like Walker B domain-containing protein [Azospirillaceae bacterium]
ARLDGVATTLETTCRDRAGLLNGQPVVEVKKELGDRYRMAEQERAQRESDRHEAATRAAAADQEAASRATLLETRRTQANEARTALDAALATLGLDEAEARRRLARDAVWLAQEEKALADLEMKRRDTATLLEERTRQVTGHHAQGEPEHTAKEAESARTAARATLDDTRARQGAAAAQLHADDTTLTRRADILADHARQKNVWRLWQSLNDVIGSANGGKLRNFAQSLSLDLLLGHANHHLIELARRYRLERVAGSDLEIQVIDRDMGDEVRSVHSLSGGETFLVSLALALGLSSMAGGHQRVGTLFIDEGFGSLDPASLDTALASLEALQATGRQVGVISHVPALVERIGVQVRVTALGGGRSRVRVAAPHPFRSHPTASASA